MEIRLLVQEEVAAVEAAEAVEVGEREQQELEQLRRALGRYSLVVCDARSWFLGGIARRRGTKFVVGVVRHEPVEPL